MIASKSSLFSFAQNFYAELEYVNGLDSRTHSAKIPNTYKIIKRALKIKKAGLKIK